MGFYIGKGKASRSREGFIPNPKLKLLASVNSWFATKEGACFDLAAAE